MKAGNVNRRISDEELLARRTHCKYGHELGNHILRDKKQRYRICLECGRIAAQKRRDRLKQLKVDNGDDETERKS